MNKVVVILILGIIIAVGIGYAASVGSPPKNPENPENPVPETYPDDTDLLNLPLPLPQADTTSTAGTTPTENPAPETYPDDTDSSSPPQEDTTSTTNTSPNPTGGEYVDYSDSLVDQMLADGKRVVLFFYAAWCPTCRLADRRIREATHRIPSDVVIVRVDYDREKDLKKTYGISYQHTFVQLAEGRSPVTKFQGSSTLPAILANIQ